MLEAIGMEVTVRMAAAALGQNPRDFAEELAARVPNPFRRRNRLIRNAERQRLNILRGLLTTIRRNENGEGLANAYRLLDLKLYGIRNSYNKFLGCFDEDFVSLTPNGLNNADYTLSFEMIQKFNLNQ